MSSQDEQKWQLAGWVGFLACSCLFIFDSWRNGAMVALMANILFFVACILFIVPLVYNLRDADETD